MLEFSSATCCAWISLLVISAVHLQVYSSSLVDLEMDFLLLVDFLFSLLPILLMMCLELYSLILLMMFINFFLR